MSSCKQVILMTIMLSIPILGQDTPHESTTAPQETVDSSSNLVDALNGLGYRLMTEAVKSNNSTNIVISPVGVSVMLAMALLGSTGSTYNEIADVLGFSHDILENRKHHEDLGNLLQALNDTTARTMLTDAVAVDQRTRLRAEYRAYLRRVYQGEALSADFANGTAARQAINEWVTAHTENEIENFLKENLPLSTKVVLVNALHFKGQWAHPFNPEFTNKMVFRTPEKEVITDFMLNVGKIGYVSSNEDGGLHMVAVPYNDNITTMYALKPRHSKRLSLSKLLENLDYKKIDKLINQMTTQKCLLRFPKMNITSNLSLEKYIKRMGAPSMFNPSIANFALMIESDDETVNKSQIDYNIPRMKDDEGDTTELKDLLDNLPNPGIHIDTIIQEVKIKIDEYGTEATAATAGILARTAEMFYADSPFLMFIRNEKTKLITFSAVIFDPTEKAP